GEGDPRAWAASAVVGGSPLASEPSGGIGANGFDLWQFVSINEFLAVPGTGQTEFIELYNHSGLTIDLNGCLLSTNKAQLDAFAIPPGTSISPHGFVVFYKGSGAGQLPFAPGVNGGAIYLTRPDRERVIDAVSFPAQVTGVSMGRTPDGAPGLQNLASQTPGAANSGPSAAQIVINEIMFKPISGNPNDTFIELYNPGGSQISVNGWQIHGVGSANEAWPIPNTTIAAGGYLVAAKDPGTLF